MPRLSIVIPFLGHLKRLEDTLVSVLENRPADCQILVVLNQPYDDPYELEGEVSFAQALPGSRLVDCVELGIAASSAPIVHVLACGLEATPGWVDAALPHFVEPDVAAVVPVIVDRFDTRRILSAGLKYTASGAIRRLGAGRSLDRFHPPDVSHCGADLLAGFYRKSALEAVAPWTDRAADRTAAVQWTLALQHGGYRCVLEKACLTAANAEMLTVTSQLREGLEAERLFWRWAPVAGWKCSLAAHAGLLAVETLGCLVRPVYVCRLAGRMWSAVQGFSHGRHWRSLREPIQPPAETIRPPHFALSEHCKSQRSRIAS